MLSINSRNEFIKGSIKFFNNPSALIIGIIFALHNLLFVSWISYIPFIKAKLDIADAQLGLVLFSLPVGSLLMNPFTGRIISRLGEARACLYSATSLALAVCIPVGAFDIYTLSIGLFLMGLSAALFNIAMNTAAINLEKQQNITIMSSCHGMYSLGGLLGSAIAGVVIAGRIQPWTHVFIISTLVIIFVIVIYPKLAIASSNSQFEAENTSHSSLIKPSLDLWLLIIIGITISIGEGVAFDWSGVYLRETLNSSSQIAAFGFGCFSLTMTSLRFAGDAITLRVGSRRWLQFGGLMGGVGLLLAIIIPYPLIALMGFGFLGIGCSLGSPILYSAALRMPRIHPASGLATFASFSFVGFLAAPPLIGFISDFIGLKYGLAFVGLLMLLSSLIARKINI